MDYTLTAPLPARTAQPFALQHCGGCYQPAAHCTCAPAPLDSLALITGLDAAIRVLASTRIDLAHGSITLWRLVDHAAGHLEAQVRELMAEDAQ